MKCKCGKIDIKDIPVLDEWFYLESIKRHLYITKSKIWYECWIGDGLSYGFLNGWPNDYSLDGIIGIIERLERINLNPSLEPASLACIVEAKWNIYLGSIDC